MANSENAGPDWLAVIGRAQAYLALNSSSVNEGTVLERAKFLMTLGLTRSEAAGLLGSSDDSLRVQFARDAKKASGA